MAPTSLLSSFVFFFVECALRQTLTQKPWGAGLTPSLLAFFFFLCMSRRLPPWAEACY